MRFSIRLTGFIVVLLLTGTLFFAGSCTSDQLPEIPEPEFCDTVQVSWQLNIRPIVETYCAYSGCHDGSSPGVYTSYEGMVPNLESGQVTERSIIQRDMPPDYANAGLTELPPAELQLLECWINAGYPEE